MFEGVEPFLGLLLAVVGEEVIDGGADEVFVGVEDIVAFIGFEHGLWFAGIVAGLAYALLYRRSGNLWAAIIAHSITNLLLGCWVVYSGNWQFW